MCLFTADKQHDYCENCWLHSSHLIFLFSSSCPICPIPGVSCVSANGLFSSSSFSLTLLFSSVSSLCSCFGPHHYFYVSLFCLFPHSLCSLASLLSFNLSPLYCSFFLFFVLSVPSHCYFFHPVPCCFLCFNPLLCRSPSLLCPFFPPLSLSRFSSLLLFCFLQQPKSKWFPCGHGQPKH